MNANYYLDKLNRLDREIVELERKIATESQIEANKNKRISTIQASFNKNTSPSMYNLKMHQIEREKKEMINAQKRRADFQKKLADKRKDRTRYSIELQKVQNKENQKMLQTQRMMQEQYERRVKELTTVLQISTSSQNGQYNLYDQIEDVEYDVFISHATEDKKTFVEDLVNALREKAVKVWYDSLNIKWGDSLRTQIDNGLKKSAFGIVVLSENYIEKGWTRYELEGLFNIEMTQGKTILPIWHNITKQQVMNFSPTLAGRMALSSALMTPDEIAEEFVKLLNK
jgi:hypothetical protein